MSRFYRRNKAFTLSAATVVLALLFGFGATLWAVREVSSTNKVLRDHKVNLEKAIATSRALLHEKEIVLERLRDEITGRALNSALVGSLAQSEQALNDASEAGADESLVTAIRGLAYLYAGDPSTAMDKLEQAVEIDKDSIPAWSGLWLAALHLGQYDRMSEAREHIIDFEPQTDTEKLFFSQLTRHTAPGKTVDILVELVKRHPGWGAAYSLLGRARINAAKDRYLEPDALSRFTDALGDFEKAEMLTPQSEFVLSDYLLALLESREFALENSLHAEAEEWMATASTLAARLGEPSRHGGYAFKARTFYLQAHGDTSDLDTIWEDMRHDRSTATWVRAASLFADDRMPEYGKLLKTSGGPVDDLLRIFYLAETSDDPTNEALTLYAETFGGKKTAADVDHIALYAYLLLGDLAGAREEAKRLQRKRSFASGRWWDYVLNYIADPDEQAEERIKRLAGPFLRERSFAYYAIGMVALAEGKRKKALDCFAEVQKAPSFDNWHYLWAFAFTKRMADSEWPPWIEFED